MKRSKRIYLLLGVLAFASIATVSVMQLEEKKEEIKNSDQIVLEVPTEAVKSLSWEHNGESLSFHKEEEWVYNGDAAFPVDEEKINQLLEQFQSFGAAFIIENVEDYGQYGLEDPTCTIDFSTGDQSYQVLLGSFSTMDSQRYVSIGDGNVYLVKNDPLEQFDAVLSDVIDHDDIPSLSNAKRIQFDGTEAYEVLYQEDSPNTYCDEDVFFAQQGEESLPLATDKVKGYLGNISTLNLTNYVTYNATAEDLHTYGLDAPELTVTVDYVPQNDDSQEEAEEKTETFVLHVSRSTADKETARNKISEETQKTDEDPAAEEEEITAYGRVGNSPIVYKLYSGDFEEIMEASYDSLRHQEVFSGAFEDITQIDISLEGKNYAITSQLDGEERAYYYQASGEDQEETEDSQPPAALETDDLKTALSGLKAETFTSEQPSGKEEIGLVLHLDNENFPQVQISLYRYDGTSCLATVDGEPFSLVPRSSVVKLIEAVNAIVL